MVHAHLDLRWWLLGRLAYLPHAGEWYTAITIAIALLFVASAFYPALSERSSTPFCKRLFLPETSFLVLLIGHIFWSRLHCLLPPALNPDEPQFIAGAVRLLHDPVFWRSVDGTTSGPLNIYPLTLPAFLGFKLEYASSRLVGLALIISSVICLYYSLRVLYGRTVARLGVLPVASCVAFMRYYDYVHYSSEHVSIAILSGALLLICRYHVRSRVSGRAAPLFFIGLLLGAVPYAKLQAVPAAFLFACAALHSTWVYSPGKQAFLRRAGALALGGIFFSVIVGIILCRFSLWELFMVSYIRHNVFYAHAANGFFFNSLQGLYMMVVVADTRPLFFLLLCALIGSVILIIKKKGILSAVHMYAFANLCGAFYGVTYPGRPFGHYLLFLLIPAGFLIGSFLGELKKAGWRGGSSSLEEKPLSLAIVCILAMISSGATLSPRLKARTHLPYRAIFAQRYPAADPRIARVYAYTVEHSAPYWGWSPSEYKRSGMRPSVEFSPRVRRIEEAIMRQAAAVGSDSMAVWGWAAELYIDTGLTPAVRYGVNNLQALPSSLQKTYLRLFADDVERSKTKLFIDAMPPGMRWYVKEQGHRAEDYPEIAEVLRKEFFLIEEVEGVRIYLRRDFDPARNRK